MEKQNLVKVFNLPKIFIFCFCFILSGCISAVFTSANVAYNHNAIQHQASDYLITFRIKNTIDNDPVLASQSAIDVTSFNQIVLLTGQATSSLLRQKAATIAQNTPNVLRVYNAIAVNQSLASNTLAVDSWITTKVKTKLIANNSIDPSKIKVVTENQVVYLMGIVPKDQADIAVDIARNTDGVDRVVKIFYYVIMPKIN